MAKVTLKGYILVPEKDLQEVCRELINHRRLTLNEPGCISFTVTEGAENQLRFDVFEEFVDRQSFDFHQARVRASRWGQVTVDVTRYYEILD